MKPSADWGCLSKTKSSREHEPAVPVTLKFKMILSYVRSEAFMVTE
jgi:hypothetical protein